MIRAAAFAFLSLALVVTNSHAENARKAARALHAQEKEVLFRITQRIEFDKKLHGSTVKVEVDPGGSVVLSGSVMNDAARRWAVELVENTTGVTTVVDELAVASHVKVYDAKSPAPVVEVARPIVVPAESRVIVKP